MSGVTAQRRIPECFENSLRQTCQFELDRPWTLSVSHLEGAIGCLSETTRCQPFGRGMPNRGNDFGSGTDGGSGSE
jgi:hypothetical protein